MAGVLVLAAFLYTVSSRIGSASTWSSINTCGMPSNSAVCQVGSAINTSGSIQTKTGPLTFSNGLIVSNPYTHTCDVDSSVPCSIDADCIEVGAGSSCTAPAKIVVNGTFNWTNVTDPNVATRTTHLTSWDISTTSNLYVDLFTEASHVVREGYMAVKNPADPVTAGVTATINVVAAAPSTGQPSYAVTALDNISSQVSYAVLAKAGDNDAKSVALRAIAPKSGKLSWAAYFRGNVSVEQPFSVVMGGAGDLNPNVTASLCLGGYDAAHPRVCYSQWPAEGAGDAEWYDTGGYLQQKTTSLNFAVGGDDSSAPFYLAVQPDSAADLVVNGTGQSQTLTIN